MHCTHSLARHDHLSPSLSLSLSRNSRVPHTTRQLAVIFGMVSSQVLARVARVSFADAVRFNASAAELSAMVSTFFILLLALATLGSSGGFVAANVYYLGVSAYLLVFVILFSTWRISVHAKVGKEEEEEEEEEEKKEGGNDNAERPFRRPLRDSVRVGPTTPSPSSSTTTAAATEAVHQRLTELGVALKEAKKDASVAKERADAAELKASRAENDAREAKDEARDAKDEASRLRAAMTSLAARLDALEEGGKASNT